MDECMLPGADFVTADDGFYFGLGVFETIAVRSGRLILEKYHQERLFSGLSALNIPIPAGGWEGICEKIAGVQSRFEEENPQFRENYVIKVCVTPKNLAVSARANHYTQAQYQRGFRLQHSTILRNSTSPFTFLKSLNCGDNILEKRRAQQSGFDEPVFLNQDGLVTEGATTNLFGVLDGVLVTPKLTCGLLPGTVRRYLLERCSAHEVELTPEQFARCSEIFVTNAILGIMPVSFYNGNTFSPGPVTAQLRRQYSAEVEAGG